ncbi:MAG: hypothetical protein ACFFDN_04205 [Candidatus Hodarchaeota archaeon]
MTLSDKSIRSFKNKPQQSIWNYLTALQQLQNALFELEKDENNPEVLQDLSTRALEIGQEIESILNLMEGITED